VPLDGDRVSLGWRRELRQAQCCSSGKGRNVTPLSIDKLFPDRISIRIDL
jgi:hypothetical protein